MSSDASPTGADPWGREDPPLLAPGALPPLPEHLTVEGFVRSGRRTFPHPDELPEVRLLRADGWEPFEDAPLYWNVPAVWPPALRGWLPDRLPRIMMHFDGRRTWTEPWDDETAAGMYDDRVTSARRLGLPDPLDGRRWLLRSPWPTVGVGVVLLLAHTWASGPDEHDDGDHDEEDALLRSLQDLLALSEDEVWQRWGPQGGRVARLWRAQGRVGADAARLVLAQVSPADLARLTAAAPDGAGLTEEQALDWVEAAGTADRVLAWRRLGLPADLPAGLHGSTLHGTAPDEVAPWLAAGFGVEVYEQLAFHGLDVATRWRTAGFDTATTARLLDADPVLSPQEASAFDAAAIDGADRERWVAAGFTAAEALAWTAVQVHPGEARVWRARGLRPDDVPPGPRSDLDAPRLPEGPAVGWFSWGGDPADRQYGVTDPAGTRGRLAAENHDRAS